MEIQALRTIRHKVRFDLIARLIRINDQWPICFVLRDGDALDVEIVDYH